MVAKLQIFCYKDKELHIIFNDYPKSYQQNIGHSLRENL